MSRVRRRVIFVSASAVVLIGLAAWVRWPTWLLYNASESAPRGWYLQRPLRALRPGQWVFASLLPEAAKLAHARGYLPQHLPILKRIGAVEGQVVCVAHGQVRIDDRVVGFTRAYDRLGRLLAPWHGCRSLCAGELFLLTDHRASFDSRYFGPVRRDAILGEAVPLWTW